MAHVECKLVYTVANGESELLTVTLKAAAVYVACGSKDVPDFSSYVNTL